MSDTLAPLKSVVEEFLKNMIEESQNKVVGSDPMQFDKSVLFPAVCKSSTWR